MPYRKERAKRRWTTEMMKIYKKFCGWDRLQQLVNGIQIGIKGSLGEILINNEEERDEAQAIVATTFETGARIAEVLGQDKPNGVKGLRVDNFDLTGTVDSIGVIFTLCKRWEEIKSVSKFKAIDGTKMRWVTEDEAKRSGREYEIYKGQKTRRLEKVRSVNIPRKEPLVPLMVNWVKRKMLEGRNTKLFNIKYNKFYRTITAVGREIGEDFPPHRLRAERATQMAIQYNCPERELDDWFSWKPGGVMARTYTTVAGVTLERMMEGAKKLFGGG